MSYLTDEQLVAVHDEINRVVNADEVGCAIHVLTLVALLAEVQAARQLLHDVEAIRCNSEENTYGVGFCDLPEETQPHSFSDHLKAQLRAINTATRAALTAYQQGKETQ